MSREELMSLTVAELKVKCKDLGIGSAEWRNFAKKTDLVESILSGEAIGEVNPTPLEKQQQKIDSDPDLADAIIKAISGKIGGLGNVDEAMVQKIVDEKVKEGLAGLIQKIEYTDKYGDIVIEGEHYHKQFDMLKKAVSSHIPVWLCGPSGTGKSKVAEQIAEVMKLNFRTSSVCTQTTKSDLLGYMSSSGLYVRTGFRECYENGGVYLLDEVDSGNPNVLLVLNNATSNGGCDFPDGRIKKHKDFYLVAAGNTWGLGADRVYVGRVQIDGATLNRFAFINWDIDEDLEYTLAHSVGYGSWAKTVQSFRRKAKELKIRCLITPRDTIKGMNLLATGLDEDTVKGMCFLNPLDDDAKVRLCA